MRKRKIRKRSR